MCRTVRCILHVDVPAHDRWASVRFHHDKATRAVGYATRGEALEAVGLRSRPAEPVVPVSMGVGGSLAGPC